jgi:hypothetical protein
MNEHEDRSSSTDERHTSPSSMPESGTARKAYEKPQIIYRAPLEAMASVCAPSPPSKSNPGLCPQGPISS